MKNILNWIGSLFSSIWVISDDRDELLAELFAEQQKARIAEDALQIGHDEWAAERQRLMHSIEEYQAENDRLNQQLKTQDELLRKFCKDIHEVVTEYEPLPF